MNFILPNFFFYKMQNITYPRELSILNWKKPALIKSYYERRYLWIDDDAYSYYIWIIKGI